MHYRTVDGHRLPRPLGGHPALDFCNTYAGWNAPDADPLGGRRGDYLTSFDVFAVWVGAAGLLDPATVTRLRRQGEDSPAAAGAALLRARRLRALGYRSLTGDAAAFDALGPIADRANAASRLRRSGDGPATRDPVRGVIADADRAVALAVEDLLRRDPPAPVRACPGPDCGWLFLDPRGRRTWCSMADCGNRAKVAAHAARRRAQHS